MGTQDLTDVFRNYENKWVALDDNNKVIASAASLDEVLKLARQKGVTDPITASIPDYHTEYVL